MRSPDSKRHFEVLDGLRGVAALVVVVFHIFEAFSTTGHVDLIIGHGYLAVDFFFALSGFVMGYAYDDRWERMTFLQFARRRLTRLHPMVMFGMLVGAVLFYFGGSPVLFPLVDGTPLTHLFVVTLVGFTLLPLPLSWDIRGQHEMHPLNGPAWSLFYEYVTNFIYAVWLRKASKLTLFVLAAISGAALVHLSVFGAAGDVIGGWSLEPAHVRIGITRLAYPFLAGLLLSRLPRPKFRLNAFLWCGLVLVASLVMPRVGEVAELWQNGLYDALAILFVFPSIVWVGTSGPIANPIARRLAKLIGDISYPLYITHYPLIYVFTAWVVNEKVSVQEAWPEILATFVAAVVLAWASFKFYDEPVRQWLAGRTRRTKP